MSIEENKDIARRFLQVWGQASLATVDELAAADLTVSYPQASSAAAFGTLGVEFRAGKPAARREWDAGPAALLCGTSRPDDRGGVRRGSDGRSR